MSTEALRRAIDLVGGQEHLAKATGTTQSQVWYWLKRSKRGVPGEFAPRIEEATGGVVRRTDLRPDIFKPEAPQAVAV